MRRRPRPPGRRATRQAGGREADAAARYGCTERSPRPEPSRTTIGRQRPRPPRPHAIANELASLSVLLYGDPQARRSSGPSRTWMSQRSPSPPRVMFMHRARRSRSSSSSRSVGDRHCSLQTLRLRGHGKANASSPRRRHGVSPPRSRPLDARSVGAGTGRAVTASDRGPSTDERSERATCAANGFDGKRKRRGREEQQLDSHRSARRPGDERAAKMPTTDSSASSRSGGTTRA